MSQIGFAGSSEYCCGHSGIVHILTFTVISFSLLAKNFHVLGECSCHGVFVDEMRGMCA